MVKAKFIKNKTLYYLFHQDGSEEHISLITIDLFLMNVPSPSKSNTVHTFFALF